MRKYSINRSESARVMIGPARSHRPTSGIPIPHHPEIIGSCLAPMGPGEPGAAPLPVRLRGGDPAPAPPLLARGSPIRARPPEPPWSLASAPTAEGRVPDDIRGGEGAWHWDDDPASPGRGRLSRRRPDRRNPGISPRGPPGAGPAAAELIDPFFRQTLADPDPRSTWCRGGGPLSRLLALPCRGSRASAVVNRVG